MRIEAKNVHYKLLNNLVRDAVSNGKKDVALFGVNGQRYIGDGLKGEAVITVHGTAGNDLAAFMDGPTVVVKGNAQDGVGNTMNSGKVVVHGEAGDILGYGMRGGKIFIRSNVGYRTGIHMKSYPGRVPIIVAGGRAGDFFGEYMAGGILILLGLERGEKPIVGDYCATGIHGGAIFIRGEVEKHRIGQEAAIDEPSPENMVTLHSILFEFCSDFGLDLDSIMSEKFVRLYPYSSRPYGRLYAY
jgi:glutamate synthase domain-containing protein 3